MKRVLSIILTLALLMSTFTVFFVSTVSADALITISNTSPAITATEGDTVTLSNYSVVFDGDTEATSGISWKDENGDTVTSLTAVKGVSKLTAVSGSKSKTIYVVVKAENEKDYVLYETDFSEFSSFDALTAAGWSIASKTAANASFAVSNGVLTITSIDADNRWTPTPVLLPSWLGDFGDYSFTADVKLTDLVNSDVGRWLALIYRDESGAAEYPYFQMCARADTTGGSGVEMSERIAGEAWGSVKFASTGHISDLGNAYHSLNVKAYGQTVAQSIDGRQTHHINAEEMATLSNTNTKGGLGLSVAGAKLWVNSVRVTVQENAPAEEASLELINNDRLENVLINPIANVQYVTGNNVSEFNGKDAPDSAMMFVSTLNDVNETLKNCLANQIIPTFYIASQSEADLVLNAAAAYNCHDINIITDDTDLLSYVRENNSLLRTGLAMLDLGKTSLTNAEANELRLKIRSAPATFCLIDSDSATREVVSALQEFAVAVWVYVDSAAGSDAFKLNVVKAVTSGANGIVTKGAVAANDLINTCFKNGSMTRTPIVIGHRGNPSQAAENSVASFLKAYENGADVVELDVLYTSDKQLLVMHDENLSAHTTYKGDLTAYDMTLEQIKGYHLLDANKNETTEVAPSLEEALTALKGLDIKIFIEFKDWKYMPETINDSFALVQELGMTDQVCSICFIAGYLNTVQTVLPGMSTGLLSNSMTEKNCTTVENTLLSLNQTLTEAQNCNSTVNPDCTVVNSDGNLYTKAAVDRGITVWPWTYNEEYGNNIGFMSGSDGITTDDAQIYKDAVKYLEAESFSLAVGSSYAGGVATAVTYGREEILLGSDESFVTVIKGDCVEYSNGKLTAVKAGTASAIIGHVTATAYGERYVVYSQPITITVNSGSKAELTNLIEAIEVIKADEYSYDNIEALRDLYDDAKAMISNSSATASEISQLSIAISTRLNDYVGTRKIVSVGADYTTTAPNYFGSNNRYVDDGMRLTDGVKNCIQLKTNAYSVWSGTPIDVIIDLGEGAQSNIYNVYSGGGGFWGVNAITGITVYGSNDGINYSDALCGTTDVTETGDAIEIDGVIRKLYKATAVSGTVNNYRYIKITVNGDGNFIWIDEAEVILDTDEAAVSDVVTVNKVNSIVAAGDSVIFTSDFNNGVITAGAANHRYTQNLIAKWSEAHNAYIVQSNIHGDGETATDINLADGEILIATHAWEETVPGSETNKLNLAEAKAGDIVELHGIDAETLELGTAPYITFSDHVHIYSEKMYDENGHWLECVCGDKGESSAHSFTDNCDKLCDGCDYLRVAPHNFEWTYDENGHKQICACGVTGNEAAEKENVIAGMSGSIVTGGKDTDSATIGRLTDGIKATEEYYAATDNNDYYLFAADNFEASTILGYGTSVNTVYYDISRDAMAYALISEINIYMSYESRAWDYAVETSVDGSNWLAFSGSVSIYQTTDDQGEQTKELIVIDLGGLSLKANYLKISVCHGNANTVAVSEIEAFGSYVYALPEGTVIETEEHGYDDDCDASCDECGYERTAPHVFSEEWSSDENSHWHECTCGEKSELIPHIPGEWTAVTQPQVGIEGLEELHCTECGDLLDSRPIDALKDDFIYGDVNMSYNGSNAESAVNISDCILIKRNILKTYEFNNDQFLRGDINEDGKINISDYILCKRIILKTYSK